MKQLDGKMKWLKNMSPAFFFTNDRGCRGCRLIFQADAGGGMRSWIKLFTGGHVLSSRKIFNLLIFLSLFITIRELLLIYPDVLNLLYYLLRYFNMAFFFREKPKFLKFRFNYILKLLKTRSKDIFNWRSGETKQVL